MSIELLVGVKNQNKSDHRAKRRKTRDLRTRLVLLLNLIDLRKWHEFSEQIKKPSKAKLKQSQITFN